MTKLSSTDQIKALRDDVKEVSHDVSFLRAHFDNMEFKMKAISTDVNDLQKSIGGLQFEMKGLYKRFDLFEKTLFDWKSHLFNKIDNFIGRIDRQDKEIAAQGFQIEEIHSKVFTTSG